MNSIKLNKVLFWLPRILSLFFVFFLSLFSLDVFDQYQGWSAILPWAIHSLPALVLLLAVIVSWRFDLLGAVIFLGFAVNYVLMVGLDRQWSWYITIAGPAGVMSLLYFLSWKYKNGKKYGHK